MYTLQKKILKHNTTFYVGGCIEVHTQKKAFIIFQKVEIVALTNIELVMHSWNVFREDN